MANTIMLAEVYDALVAAGAPDDKARKAAEAVAEYNTRLSSLSSDVRLIQWMVGFNLAFTMAVLWKVFA
ncbi:MAG: hypothetical protein SFV19_05195 [Rhodospirillaceae bacterium]|nr:hypothetical protein [Rhodospirillaceae bacterium]